MVRASATPSSSTGWKAKAFNTHSHSPGESIAIQGNEMTYTDGNQSMV